MAENASEKDMNETETCYRCGKETDRPHPVELNTGPNYACLTCYKKRRRYFARVDQE